MGSYFEVRVPARAPGAAGLAEKALELVDGLEAQMTVYRDDSEVSRINREAGERAVAVEPRLFGLIEAAVELSAATGGAYDIAAGALSEVWGFVKGPKRVPEPAELEEARERTGSRHIRLNREVRTIRYDRPGVALNLGSIGKGYALDRVGELIRGHWWPMGGLVHAGRSSLLAVGSPPDDFGGRWKIAVRNPIEPEKPLGVLSLRNRGLGTSGLAYQYFESGGKIYGHILDPRTGDPYENGPASVTVLAPTAAEADALSTAFFLMGADQAESFLMGRPEVGALFVIDDGEDRPPRVRTINLARDDWEPDPRAAGPRIG
jgi:thiamine biosynthesis lipoprotein